MGSSTYKYIPGSYQQDVMNEYGYFSNGTPDNSIEFGSWNDNAANAGIAVMNNNANMAIHAADNKFNAEQAQLARDWSSEEAVMARRDSAGINSAMLGGGSSAGSSSAAGGVHASAGAPPTLSTPHMENKTIDRVTDVIGTAADAAEKISGVIKDTKEGSVLNETAKNLAVQTQGQVLQNEHQKIINDYTPQQVTAEINSLLSGSKKAISDTSLNGAIAIRTMMEAREIASSIYEHLVMSELAQGNYNLTAEQLRLNTYQFAVQLEQDVRKEVSRMKMDAFKFSWNLKYGSFTRGGSRGFDSSHSRSSSSSDSESYSRSSYRDFKRSVDGSVSSSTSFAGFGGLPAPRSGGLPAPRGGGFPSSRGGGLPSSRGGNGGSFDSLLLDGSRNSTSSGWSNDFSGSLSHSNSSSSSNSESSSLNVSAFEFEKVQNTQAYKDAVETMSLCHILMDPKSTSSQIRNSLERIRNIRVTFEDFKTFYNRLDSIVNSSAQPEFQQTP